MKTNKTQIVMRLAKPLTRRNADRIRVLVDCCGALQEGDTLCLFPGKNPQTGKVFDGLTAELDMLLRGHDPVTICKEVKG